MVKDTVTKQWHATIKMAGSWKRPGVTAMVIHFFFSVLYVGYFGGAGKMHMSNNRGKCSKLNLMGTILYVYHLYVTGHSMTHVSVSRRQHLSPKVRGGEALQVRKNNARNLLWD